MNIRPKIILVVLPLILAPLILAALVSYLSARNGITAVASDFLRFKSETLTDYMEGQWSLLTENDLDGDPEYVAAARRAVAAFSANLIRSSTERIIALDGEGSVVMDTDASASGGKASPGGSAYSGLELPADGIWMGDIRLEDEVRVGHVSRYIPWNWTVMVTESRSGFYGPVVNTAYLIGGIGALSLILAVIFLVVVTGLISRPLENMVTVIDGIIETADLDTRVDVVYRDETGRLAHSFNMMLENLAQANRDIKDFALRAVLAQRQAKKLRVIEKNTRVLFQKYVPQSVIDSNIGRVGQELLEPKPREVSILMSDIRDFTGISERIGNPVDLVESLNRYFELMVDVVDRHKGITDKYIGDAVMALFGATESNEDDVLRSVLAGLEMLEELKVFNREQKAAGKFPFAIGIGIHFGEVTAGNIGSEKKMDYTVIGETVNIASRLEGLTKFYDTSIIVSEEVFRHIGEAAEPLFLDRVSVKGSTEKLDIYTVEKSLTPEDREFWDRMAMGQKEYYDCNFPGARRLFRDSLRLKPHNRLAGIFLERTLEYIRNPVRTPEDWDGVYRHSTK